ncbi:MAG TPA: hypothetical protein VMS96_07230 [Terriglobales bacterium]|nr:hypothetical protein [Terriglobales bacterium]
MKKTVCLAAVLCIAALLLPALLVAQAAPNRPFHDGTVWNITFVKVKPGVGLKYMNYLASDWKKEQEALKKAGLILSYKVIATEAHGTSDWDLMLMTEFKDLASLEANQDKMEAVATQALQSNDQKMIEGYQERASWREIVGERLSREIILESKAK